VLYEKALTKFDDSRAVLEMNLAAQANILTALAAAHSEYAESIECERGAVEA
jgi:hypothetical protein